MISQTDRILVVNHHLPIGAAIVRRLIRLGHPSSHIVVPPSSELDWSDSACVQAFLQANRPDQIYVGGSAFSHCDDPHPFDRADANRKPAELAPLIEAACRAGVRQLMHVATATTFRAADLDHDKARRGMYEGSHIGKAKSHGHDLEEVLLRRALMEAFGDHHHNLDYRCVLTCEPYGPSWSTSGAWLSNHAGPADRLISRALHQLTAATASAAQGVTVEIDPTEHFDLMFVDDVADAIVFLMELPQAAFRARLSPGCGHITLGTGAEVNSSELVGAVATAVGFRGPVAIDPVYSPHHGCRMDSRHIHELGWRPLVDLRTGLELTAMAFHISQIARRGMAQSLPAIPRCPQMRP